MLIWPVLPSGKAEFKFNANVTPKVIMPRNVNCLYCPPVEIMLDHSIHVEMYEKNPPE